MEGHDRQSFAGKLHIYDEELKSCNLKSNKPLPISNIFVIMFEGIFSTISPYLTIQQHHDHERFNRLNVSIYSITCRSQKYIFCVYI